MPPSNNISRGAVGGIYMKLITEIWTRNDDSEMASLETVIKSKELVKSTQKKSADETKRLTKCRL